MQNQAYRDKDASLDALKDKVIAVLGHGVQGRPQALCMRDSGLNVIVGTSPRDRYADWDKAEKDGFEVLPFAEATQAADVVHVLLADPAQPEVHAASIHQNL
jgi:ketol-acid reductoisomerase